MPELHFLNGLDYFVLGLYMLMVLVVGIYVARFNQQTSDYFKGGGHVPWGLAMASLFVSGFSAFMFVGAAGFTYNNGGAALILFSMAVPAYLLGYWIYGPLWQRTRIDTPMQFLTRRFSPGTTYFYTLLAVIPNVLILGISVYTLCIFISTALGFNQMIVDLGLVNMTGFQLTILVTGIVMVFYTMLGGLWAVMVTDALQFVIVFLVSLLILPVAFHFLGDGNLLSGINRLLTEAPDGYFSLNLKDQPGIFWLAYFINIILGYNVNWHIAQRYYSVPDEKSTRKMALWCAGLSLLLPLLWILPVMTSVVLFPDISSMWPELAKPSEAAFVTLALSVLPHGLLGIMVAAIFAATMSSADTTFNWLAAVVTKDVYVPLQARFSGNPPGERAQLLFGRFSVGIMGILAIWIALNMDRFGGAFDVYLRADSLYKPAMFMPVILGLVFTRTPWWSGMAALGAGVLAIILVGIGVNMAHDVPVTLGGIFAPISVAPFGIEMGRYEINTLVGAGVSTLVFFTSALFNRRTGAFQARITALEEDLNTPALPAETRPDLRGLRAYTLAGRLSLVIGLLLILLTFFTWDRNGWLNAVAGLLALGLGGLILWIAGRNRTNP